MEVFVEQALTYTECLNKIRMKYGDRITIMHYKNIRMGGFLGLFAKDGVEITFFAPNAVLKPGAFQGGPFPQVQNSPGQTDHSRKTSLNFEEEKKKILDANSSKGESIALQQVLKEVKELKQQISATASAGQTEKHSTISRIEEILDINDFSPIFSQTILDRIKKEFSLDGLNDYTAVQDTVLEWIGESITVYKEEKFQRLPRIMVLVGPTGVGKTTTIAKLAAIYGLGNFGRRPISVRMITIDAFRIGARDQIEAYGNIMALPVSYVEDYDDLKKTIAQYSEGTDLFLIDTIGKSPRDSRDLGEMKQLLDACGSQAELYLAVAATTKLSDLKEIIRQFEPFNYRSVIVTKLDETIRVGNVISALSDLGKSVSYITYGQKVPSNIQKATIVRFLINLEGFQVNRAKIEARFPTDEAEQIQWR
ncbi:MAG: flagellar biosynthesis protein FlhF [Spirochaetaceae bacterium]|jgi:flagellar biosynthesis protein FlhF|nr:flagellar biosynthesis protein FlhF [Spirochaetaceae bacterium]